MARQYYVWQDLDWVITEILIAWVIRRRSSWEWLSPCHHCSYHQCSPHHWQGRDHTSSTHTGPGGDQLRWSRPHDTWSPGSRTSSCWHSTPLYPTQTSRSWDEVPGLEQGWWRNWKYYWKWKYFLLTSTMIDNSPSIVSETYSNGHH